MNDFSLLPVLAGAVAFFAVGMVWYGGLFGKAWQKASGITDEQAESGNMALIFGLCFVCEFLIAAVLWHLLVRTSPAPHVIMMMAVGFAGGVMIPAMAINYLFQRKPLSLFLIDGGHFLFGMAAMGGVFILFQ